MPRIHCSAAVVLSLLLAACGDGGTGPGPGGQTATRFDQLADSIENGGDFAHAEALRHAAQVVRLIGEPTPVTLTIDGTARPFVAVAEELEFPNVVCSWPGDTGIVVHPDSIRPPADSSSTPPAPPPGPGTCEQQGSVRMRTLIAWEPERLAEVVRLVADEGTGSVQRGVPDAMAGPSHAGGSWGSTDTAVAPPPVATGPGFMGEYLQRGQAFWMSVAGTQSNLLEREGGACLQSQAQFDWARYACSGITVRFEFAMEVVQLMPIPVGEFPGDSMPGPTPVRSHQIAMAATSVAGARLSLLEWLPPPLPPMPSPPTQPMPMPMPMPGDSGRAYPGTPSGT